MVNQSNCSNHNVQERSRCSCANSYRPGPPRPSCEDRCRAQYRQCMRNCRMREDEQGFERGYEEGQYDTDMMNEDRWEYED